ncbi:unnamed protein product, partial [Medioppia subpectinata]
IAIISAGQLGLGAFNACREQHFDDVFVYERSDSLCGLWANRDETQREACDTGARLLPTTTLNSSKEMNAYSDFPFPQHYPNYVYHTLTREYLLLYAERISIKKYVKLRHELIGCQQNADYNRTSRWRLTVRDIDNDRVFDAVFDGVIVCAGRYHRPVIPDIKNRHLFAGLVVHTNTVSDTTGLESQRVVVLGVGNSGIDVAVKLAKTKLQYDQVYLSSRTGCWIFGRFFNKGIPTDTFGLRRCFDWMFKGWTYPMASRLVTTYLNKTQFDHKLFELKPKHRVFGAIAIIGAGQSGLGAFNACREQHFDDVVVYERSDSLCDETQREASDAGARLLPTTTLNSSKELNAYSDFPFPQHYPNYVHHMLMDYDRTGRWRLTVRDIDNDQVFDNVVDGVIVCAGRYHRPVIPDIKNRHLYAGRVVHSNLLSDTTGLEGQWVVVLGVGNSGIDIAVELTKPKHRVFSQGVVFSDDLANNIMKGSITIKSNIQEFTTTGVIFEGETVETPCDTVIYGTGYQQWYPYLPDELRPELNPYLRLYKHIFYPHLKHAHTLAITFNMTPAGAANPMVEQQYRYFALLMADRCRLPSEKRMLRDIRRQKAWVIRYYPRYNKHSTHVRYIKYMDELAREMGVKPRLWKYAFTDPKLWWRVYAGPCVPYQYRLDGPNSWPDAREAILTVDPPIRVPFKIRVNI